MLAQIRFVIFQHRKIEAGSLIEVFRFSAGLYQCRAIGDTPSGDFFLRKEEFALIYPLTHL
jgi:hypothetical protein